MCVSSFYVAYLNSLNKSYAKAVVVGKDTGYKRKKFINYTFIVNGIKYRGSSSYRDHLESINIGDTCIVRYNAEDPTSNRVVRLDNKCSILIKQKTH